MSEDSVLLQIEEDDVYDADNGRNDGESGEKELSNFEEFASLWRSSVRVTNTILQYQKYQYFNELISKENLVIYDSDHWKIYINIWRKVYNINYYLLDNLNKTPTINAWEEEQKNKDVKYLKDLTDLLLDVAEEKRNLLIPLLPIPELNLQETTPDIKNKDDNKYLKMFHDLLNFHLIIYREELSSENLLEKFKILFQSILNKKQEMDKFIRNFLIYQEEYSEEVPQHWVELQEILKNYFNDEQKQIKRNISKHTKDVQQSSQFYIFLQSLLAKDDLKRKIKINKLLKNEIYKIEFLTICQMFSIKLFTNDIELLSLLLILDIKLNFKNFIRTQDAVIQKTLNDNFLKQWRRILHVPITLIQFQQCLIHSCKLKENKCAEWVTENEKTIKKFMNINQKVCDYVINILIRMEILKHTSIRRLSQLTQDSDYLNNLLKLSKDIYRNERNILFPLPPVPKLEVMESGLNDIVFNLYHFYKLIQDDDDPRKDFRDWNKEMLVSIYKNFDNLNNFVDEYIKYEDNEKDILMLWNEFRMFLSDNINVVNDVIPLEVEQSRFVKLNRLICDKNRQWEVESQSILPNNFVRTIKNDKMYEMQIYIILLLNVTVDAAVFMRNIINLNSKLIINAVKIILQLLLKHFKYVKIDSIILNSNVCVNEIIRIVEYMQMLISKCDEENDFVIYNNLLTQFRNILQDKTKLKSTGVLKEIENIHKNISNLNTYESISKKQDGLLCNLYCFWRIFIENKDSIKENFFKWNQTMCYMVFTKLNEIDPMINKFLIENEDDNTKQMWKYFKKFIIKKYTAYDEIDPNEVNHCTFFESLFNNDSSLVKKMEFVLNSFNHEYYDNLNVSIQESEILYIIILLDAPFTLKQIATFMCEYNMSFTYNNLNCDQFNYFKLVTSNNTRSINKLVSFKFSEYEQVIKKFYNYFYAYKRLNKNPLNILDCLEEIKQIQIENNFFYLNDIPQLPNDCFQLQMINNLFLIEYRQILYLNFYFRSTKVNNLHNKNVGEKIQFFLEYIYINYEQMDEFINNYFGNFENASVFQSNWDLIRETITKLSSKDFSNSWQLFIDSEKYSYEEYFKRHRFYKSGITVEIDEKDVAQHILLILLKVPLNEIFKSKYKKPISLDDLFSLMCKYKQITPNVDYQNNYIWTQYNLTMDKFLVKLENVSSASEAENELSKLLVKSEFNRLERQEKTAIIDNLVNIIHSQKTHAYFIILFKILLSSLPLVDIILDIILAIKFFILNEIAYCGLTIGILLITGIATVITERILKSEIQWKPTYYVKILNIDKLKYLLSFTQISLFLRALNEALLRFKINMKQNKSYLEYINYGDPEFLKKETQTIKFVEMCFEAIPQTILQIYIILITKKCGIFQMVSICTSICNINVGAWTYFSTRDPEYSDQMSIMKNKRIFLRELGFYGARILSTSLMSSLFSWKFLTSWIGLHISMDLLLILLKTCKDSEKHPLIWANLHFKFTKTIYTDDPETYGNIYNYISLAEHLSFTAICSVYVHMYLKYVDEHLIFIILFFIYVWLLFTWAALNPQIIYRGGLWLLIKILKSLKAVGLINHMFCFEDEYYYDYDDDYDDDDNAFY